MADEAFPRDDERTTARFVPKDRLTMSLAAGQSPLIHGDVKDLSELGACVRTDASIDSGGVVTINVRTGYSFLFRAQARVVWRAPARRPHEPFDCSHGIVFTELSPFTQKLIRRLSRKSGGHESSEPEGGLLEGRVWDSDSDPDLQIWFRAERSPSQVDRDRLDALAEPLFEPRTLLEGFIDLAESLEEAQEAQKVQPVQEVQEVQEVQPARASFDEFIELDELDLEPVNSARLVGPRYKTPSMSFDAQALERDLSGGAELSGSLGYYDTADVLEMLEAARATGVLYIDGPFSGEIQLLDGQIGGCFSETASEDDAAFHLVVARDGRFHFVPDRILGKVRKIRTMTEVLRETKLKPDLKEPPSDG